MVDVRVVAVVAVVMFLVALLARRRRWIIITLELGVMASAVLMLWMLVSNNPDLAGLPARERFYFGLVIGLPLWLPGFAYFCGFVARRVFWHEQCR